MRVDVLALNEFFLNGQASVAIHPTIGEEFVTFGGWGQDRSGDQARKHGVMWHREMERQCRSIKTNDNKGQDLQGIGCEVTFRP